MPPKQSSRTIRRGDGFITARPQRDGSTRFQARWNDGSRWRARTFPTQDEAEDHLRTIGRSKRSGRYTPESDATVGELVAEYIARGAHRWSTNTVATYRLLARQQISPHLGTVRIVDLTPRRVQTWLDRLTASGLSAAVIENARTVLGGACKEAVQLGVLQTNPVTGTRAPARSRTVKTTWTSDEVERVLQAVEDDPLYRAFYLVALTTAVRPGELRALKWGDVDFETGVVTCQRTMTRDAEYRHMVGTTTKTGRARSIAVPSETMEALKVQRRDQLQRQLAAPAWAAHDLIFDRGDGNPLAQQTVATHHRLICERAGVRRCRLHDLRHCAATMMMRNGVSPKIVADILGHASIATTLDIYSHVSVDMQRSAVEGLADAMIRRKRDA
jgi:integrase